MDEERLKEIRKKAWSARARATSATGWMMSYAKDVEYLLSLLEETQVEWAIEVTWLDWEKAGAKGPTSQFGPFNDPSQVDQFLATQRRDREVIATRVLTRRATYSSWVGPESPDPTTEEEREALLAQLYEEIMRPI